MSSYSRSVLDASTPTQCVLMFSGGRDSTLAALRLHAQGYKLTLVTVSSDHLFGLDAVRERLREIGRILPPDTRWLRVRQPEGLRTDTSFYEMTCLPCHHAYVVVAAAVAMYLGAEILAFGYAGYQSTWPEQTPMAICRLKEILRREEISLILPVYDLSSREEALDELKGHRISQDSLEQKCMQQINNVTLTDEKLSKQITLWERAIGASLSNLSLVEINTVENTTIGAI